MKDSTKNSTWTAGLWIQFTYSKWELDLKSTLEEKCKKLLRIHFEWFYVFLRLNEPQKLKETELLFHLLFRRES